jgi:hypothetical protein
MTRGFGPGSSPFHAGIAHDGTPISAYRRTIEDGAISTGPL